MSIRNLLGINTAVKATTTPLQANRNVQNFVKNAFNFENANLKRPVATVSNSPLGDPDKAVCLDILA